jgi:hypothetical protein
MKHIKSLRTWEEYQRESLSPKDYLWKRALCKVPHKLKLRIREYLKSIKKWKEEIPEEFAWLIMSYENWLYWITFLFYDKCFTIDCKEEEMAIVDNLF